MLQASREVGVKRFVYASSSSVYGDHPDLPKQEGCIGEPLSPYAATKRANELYAHAFTCSYTELELIGLRYFNVFGKRQTPNGDYAAAIPKFIKALLCHESPKIYGDGTQSRDFTYIENVIQVNHLALAPLAANACNQVYNVACGEALSVNALVALLTEYVGKYDPKIYEISPQYVSPRIGDVPHPLASIEKASQLLGYQPIYNFKEGLKHSIAWYWEQYHESSTELSMR